MLNVILFGVLGVALAAAGINVIDRPWEFLTILAIVVGIGITAKLDM